MTKEDAILTLMGAGFIGDSKEIEDAVIIACMAIAGDDEELKAKVRRRYHYNKLVWED